MTTDGYEQIASPLMNHSEAAAVIEIAADRPATTVPTAATTIITNNNNHTTLSSTAPPPEIRRSFRILCSLLCCDGHLPSHHSNPSVIFLEVKASFRVLAHRLFSSIDSTPQSPENLIYDVFFLVSCMTLSVAAAV